MGKIIRFLYKCAAIALAVKGAVSIVYQDVTDLFPAIQDKVETKYITIHHTATMQHYTIGEVDNHHRNNNGWGSGFAYHVYIRDHKISLVHKLSDATGHALHHNSDAVAICVAGDYDVENPDWLTLAELWVVQKTLSLIYPEAQLTAHCDLNETSCCGKNLLKHVEKWK